LLIVGAAELAVYFQTVEQIVDDLHDDIIVVTFFPVLERYFGGTEVVVFEILDIVDFLHHRGQFLVYFGRIGQRVELAQIGEDLFDKMLVD
jgi:hypothetical protein